MITVIYDDLLKADVDMICHQGNCVGAMGSGLAKQIKDIYPNVYSEYREALAKWKKDGVDPLGKIVVSGTPDFYVCTMLAQRTFSRRGLQTDYDAFDSCMQKILIKAVSLKCKNVAMPFKIGCGFGGGDWNTIMEIIEDRYNKDTWAIKGIDLYIYSLEMKG